MQHNVDRNVFPAYPTFHPGLLVDRGERAETQTPGILGWSRSWSGGTTATKNYPTLMLKDRLKLRVMLHFHFFIYKDPKRHAPLFSY